MLFSEEHVKSYETKPAKFTQGRAKEDYLSRPDAALTAVRDYNLSSSTHACMQECARYLETLKSYETKPADFIQGRAEEDYLSRLNAAFTTVRGVNKTDVLTLAGCFKTAAGIMRASMQELSALPGIGPTKVRLHCRALGPPRSGPCIIACGCCTVPLRHSPSWTQVCRSCPCQVLTPPRCCFQGTLLLPKVWLIYGWC